MKIFAVYVTIALSLVIVNCDGQFKKKVGLQSRGSRRIGRTIDQQNTNVTLSTPEECARECKEGQEPLTCYYHLTLEYYGTLTQACELCTSNSTTGLTSDCQCIEADGYETSGMIVANRQFPGPSLMVCQNDNLVIDVLNLVTGNAVSLHWHGIFQKDYQYYDGAPFITQCPITEGSTFRYQWKAQNSGTHFWHSHTGFHKAGGLEGVLIVRQPKTNDLPNDLLWDYDHLDHYIFISDWFHDSAEDHFPGTLNRNPGQLPDNILINGKGRWTDPISGSVTTTPLAVYTVKAGARYRFRLINSCSLLCGVQMTIQGHNLTIIATDGIAVDPVVVTSIASLSAERYDFVIEANQTSGSYWMQFRSTGVCASLKLQQLAILRYETGPSEPKLESPSYDVGLSAGIILNPLNIRCNGAPNATNAVCVTQLKHATTVPAELLKKEPDLRIFMPFSFYKYPLQDIFEINEYKRFIVAKNPLVTRIGNIVNMFPSAPLLTQRKDIPDSEVCSSEAIPYNGTIPRICTHIEDIPLNAVVEFLLVDESHIEEVSHPFHMHGYAFHVMSIVHSEDVGVKKMSLDIAKKLHEYGMIKRNYDRPVAKDTLSVPNNGIAVIRMIANNPGYWLFHCHFMFHLPIGMALIMHVGEESDLPPIPKGFPTCGNYVPDINEYWPN